MSASVPRAKAICLTVVLVIWGNVAVRAEVSAKAKQIHDAAFVFDGHIHMINRQLYHGGDIGTRVADGQVDLPRMRMGGVDARRTIALEFGNTSRPGVYALRKQWPDKGVWTLVVGVTQGEGEFNSAKAVVEIGGNGEVARVVVPTTMRNGYRVPAPVNMAEVESSLKTRAARVASR